MRNTYQVLADFNCVFENGPHHRFIAVGGGQRSLVAVVFGTVHTRQQIVQRNATGDV